MLGALSSPESGTRAAAARLVGAFCKALPDAAVENAASFIGALTLQLADTDPVAVKAGWDALCEVTGARTDSHPRSAQYTLHSTLSAVHTHCRQGRVGRACARSRVRAQTLSQSTVHNTQCTVNSTPYK